MTRVCSILSTILLVAVLSPGMVLAEMAWDFGPQEVIQANGEDIFVDGYSVPSFVDWNEDGLADLVVGEGGSFWDGKVRVYLNVGTDAEPQFGDFFYAQSDGADLTLPAEGCLGSFPRVIYWDEDDKKDLLVGLADGRVMIFLNVGTNDNPTFDAGDTLKVGFEDGVLDVGKRATLDFLDWDNDGKTDVVVGALDGFIHIYYNCGCGGAIPPHFWFSPVDGHYAEENGDYLAVPERRSSPVVFDLDGDGRKDLITGNTAGELLYYPNTGTDEEPNFSGYMQVRSGGTPIDLPGDPRSRPSLCYWTGAGDGYPDLLVGSGMGKVFLYRGLPRPGDLDVDGDVDLGDFAILASCFGQPAETAPAGADLSADGLIGYADVQQFALVWLTGVR